MSRQTIDSGALLADLGPWFACQGLCTLTQVADYILALQREATVWQQQVDQLEREIVTLKANAEAQPPKVG